MRAQADALGDAGRPSELYVLCTSFRIDPDVCYRVYDALIRETRSYGVPTTVFASARSAKVNILAPTQILVQ